MLMPFDRPVPAIRLRRAVPQDIRAVFELSNDPFVRANSIHREPIAWEAHAAWFNRAIADPDVVFFVAEADGDFAGQVRFNRRAGQWFVSISIASAYRGRGLAKALLLDAMNRVPQETFVAEIAESNTASMRLFASAGFNEGPAGIAPSGFKTFRKDSNAK